MMLKSVAILSLCAIFTANAFRPTPSIATTRGLQSAKPIQKQKVEPALHSLDRPSTWARKDSSFALKGQLDFDDDFEAEDAATFSLEEQKLADWGQFFAAVAGVLGLVFYTWIYPSGLQWGTAFKDSLEAVCGGDTTATITLMLFLFAIAHSGLASLRPFAEQFIGARPWRYVFALVSLPLAFSCITYFINHRYDGTQLWNLHGMPYLHELEWGLSFLSFFFLYPSTFNLLEIAAVEKPTLHLWGTGIARITRHPQMVGQLMWCFAHNLHLGTTFTCATSAMLCAHHLFGCWNGDRRLRDKFGDKAEALFEKTSTVPFAAIVSGKQELPSDYYKEFLRVPYLAITVGTVAVYYAHPFMQAGAALMKW